jgi:uncharacterized protein (DUF3084 family)
MSHDIMAAACSLFSPSNNLMAKNSPPDYKTLFLQEKKKRKEAEASQKQAEASQKQAEASQKQAEASQRQAEASQRQAEASQKQAEASQKQTEHREKQAQDEGRWDRERTRLENFEGFLHHTHTYPPDR